MGWWGQLGPEMKAAIVGAVIGGVCTLLAATMQGGSASIPWGQKFRIFLVSVGLGTFAAGGVIWLAVHYGRLGVMPTKIVIDDPQIGEKMHCRMKYDFKEDYDECMARGEFKRDPAKECEEKGGWWDSNVTDCRRAKR